MSDCEACSPDWTFCCPYSFSSCGGCTDAHSHLLLEPYRLAWCPALGKVYWCPFSCKWKKHNSNCCKHQADFIGSYKQTSGAEVLFLRHGGYRWTGDVIETPFLASFGCGPSVLETFPGDSLCGETIRAAATLDNWARNPRLSPNCPNKSPGGDSH